MKQGPSEVCAILLNHHPLDAPPRTLKEMIADIVLSQGWFASSLEADQKAERWEQRTMSRLRQELQSLIEVGRPARFTFNTSSSYMIQGACFIEPGDSTELREQKQRRAFYTEYHNTLGLLSPEQFEMLCGKLLGLLGVENPEVSRFRADEGIDFYGRLKLESIFFPHELQPTIQRQLTIWLVGQAKHYQAIQAGTPDIRDLFGAIALGRAGAFGSLESPFPDLQIRVGDPVFALFVTSGSLSSNGWRLLKRSGVIGMDGEMVAAFLADKGVALGATGFDQKSFIDWVVS